MNAKPAVVVSGGFDDLRARHLRWLEEAARMGELTVLLWTDETLHNLTGRPPMFALPERRYLVGSIKYVKQALISSGAGWLDADPEIRRLKPDIYAVNEDGDRGGKREYCARMGLEYLVLQRTPAPGLPHRRSTDLRGF